MQRSSTGHTKDGFIPHPECMVASGDCFRLSKCLAACRKRNHADVFKQLRDLREQNARLEYRVIMLERKG